MATRKATKRRRKPRTVEVEPQFDAPLLLSGVTVVADRRGRLFRVDANCGTCREVKLDRT